MSELKQIAREIFERTLAAIDIPRAVERRLARNGSVICYGDKTLDLREYKQIRVVAFGKASFAMTEGLLAALAPQFKPTGVLSIPSPAPRELPGIRIFTGGHPVPNAESFAAGCAILDLLKECDQHALIFFLLSGGGSALVEQPLDAGVTLEDFQAVNRALVTCGAPIDEINAVRKHLSATKGGRLAAAAPMARKITFGVSDVPEGRESALASGPTLPDPTTVESAIRVVEHYNVLEKFPAHLRARFAGGALTETPKEGDPAFLYNHFELLLGMHDLFHQAHRAAEARGCVTICDNSTDDWPLERATNELLRMLTKLKSEHPGKRVAVIADGEVSSPVTGDGVGGRNSAFVLNCVSKIAGKPIAVLSAGTDGVDGNSPAAGSVADGTTLERARAEGLDPEDYFRRSDAYSFFRTLGDAIETGPTGNNLRDLRVLISE